MAMIRSKPDNVSADDYVRKLAEDMRNNEARLSDVCKSLEDDVIHLRQKVALMSVRGGIRSEAFGKFSLFIYCVKCSKPALAIQPIKIS